jgi:hypothetical protein
MLHEKWVRLGQDVPLEMVDAPDRRLTRASIELASREAAQKGTQVTVVLPRRGYAPLFGRILHDRTADKIASVISQVPNAAATIIPFDVESRVHLLHARQAAHLAAQAGDGAQASTQASTHPATQASTQAGTHPATQAGGVLVGGNGARAGDGATTAPLRVDGAAAAPIAVRQEPMRPAAANGGTGSASANGGTGSPAPDAGVSAIGELNSTRKATVEGKVRSVEIHPVENSCVFDATITDETGALTAKFYGRTSIPGFEPGTRVRLAGKVSMREGGPAMINPAYELLRGE